MKKIYTAGIVVVLVIGFFVYLNIVKPYIDNRIVSTAFPVTINDEFGEFSFSYLAGEDAYTLVEPPIPTTTSSGLQKVYILMDNQEYIAFEQDDLETPPTVSVFVLERKGVNEELGRTEKMQAWVEMFPQFTSYSSRIDEPEIIDIDGIPTMTYHTEGLYKQEVYVSSYGGVMYVFVGQYNDDSDEIYKMFTELISSVVYE